MKQIISLNMHKLQFRRFYRVENLDKLDVGLFV